MSISDETQTNINCSIAVNYKQNGLDFPINSNKTKEVCLQKPVKVHSGMG